MTFVSNPDTIFYLRKETDCQISLSRDRRLSLKTLSKKSKIVFVTEWIILLCNIRQITHVITDGKTLEYGIWFLTWFMKCWY